MAGHRVAKRNEEINTQNTKTVKAKLDKHNQSSDYESEYVFQKIAWIYLTCSSIINFKCDLGLSQLFFSKTM